MTRQDRQSVTIELRDSALARRFLKEGLWLARIAPISSDSVSVHLFIEVASEGLPGPATGFLADLHAILLGDTSAIRQNGSPPGFSPTLIRQYEDRVLGKLIADVRIDRAINAIRRYAPEERLRGVAFVARRLIENLKLSGVELSPAIARQLLNEPDLRGEGYRSLEVNGPMPIFVELLEVLIAAFRHAADLLAPEDVTALEQRTALGNLGQYVAHRQLLQLAARFAGTLPERPLKPLLGRREVPTRIRDEDQYPIGGYASIGTRGSIESLLHSQLAYMEPEGSPDLFDVKFVRDELFYYSRDENQFLRRRRAFGFYFADDLIEARFKDAALPAQRLVLAGALVLAAIRKLSQWLSHEALHFEITFAPSLNDEAELFEILLADERRRGIAIIEKAKDGHSVSTRWLSLSRGSQMHGLVLATKELPLDQAGVSQLIVSGPVPGLIVESDKELTFAGEDPFDAWTESLAHLLKLWI